MLDSLLTGGVSFENTIDELPEVCRWEHIRSYDVAGLEEDIARCVVRVQDKTAQEEIEEICMAITTDMRRAMPRQTFIRFTLKELTACTT